MKKALGWAMLASPFVALFALAVWKQGWSEALLMFGGFGLLFAWVMAGVFMALD